VFRVGKKSFSSRSGLVLWFSSSKLLYRNIWRENLIRRRLLKLFA
jgi:hypothetical protein